MTKQRDMDDRQVNANKIVQNHIVWSMGAGLIPVSIADLFAVSAIQLDMVRQLSKLYEIDFKETEGKAYITALTGSALARLGASAIKILPGVGSVIGGLSMSVLSGASTFALGEVFKKHFETGGTFLDFDVDRLKKFYNEKFEKGKKVAEDIKEKTEKKQAAVEKVEKMEMKQEGKKDIIGRLKELGDLKESGVISEEEFEQMKKKLIDDF